MEERDGWIECKETLGGIWHEEKAGDEWREVADFGGRSEKWMELDWIVVYVYN